MPETAWRRPVPRRHGRLTSTDSANRNVLFRNGAAAFRVQARPGIVARAPKLPVRLIVDVVVELDRFDQAAGGCKLSSVSPIEQSGAIGPALFGTRLRPNMPNFWPAPTAVTRAFLEARHSQQTGPIYLAMPVIITGTSDVARPVTPPDPRDIPLDAATALPRGMEWQFEFGDMALYSDAALTQRLYDFGVALAPPKPAIGTAAVEAPHPGGVVPFNAETLILAASRPPGGSPQLPIDWAKAAEARVSVDRGLRQLPDWAKWDPWGVFFQSRPGEEGKPRRN